MAKMEFSLFFFSDDGSSRLEDKYALLHDSVKYADERGFAAVWTPERHFHEFGGLYPNPSVTSAALSVLTKRIHIRAGSVVLPLQNPLRVAEEWAVIDNLSKGRVAIAFASGWHADDFVIRPENYQERKDLMFRDIKTVRSLWRGEKIELPNGVGKLIEVGAYPRPIQPELPIWITSQSSETFVKAGEIGANVLTNFNYKRPQDLIDMIDLYRTSLKLSGHDPAEGKVTLMMHTFLAESMEKVEQKVRPAYGRYLAANLTLQSNQASSFKANLELSQEDKDVVISNAYDRLVSTHGLVGTVKSCYEKVKLLKTIGVNEIACLIDFGIDYDSAMQSLVYLSRLKNLASVSDSITV